jgi:hypothetical protein
MRKGESRGMFADRGKSQGKPGHGEVLESLRTAENQGKPLEIENVRESQRIEKGQGKPEDKGEL